MMHYTELNKLLQERHFAKKARFKNESLQKYLDRLCIPPVPYIHVAGTNGKGSVCTKISQALTLSGYRCGRFTSPHISSFRERITIDDRPISTEKVEELLPPLLEIEELTFFELITLLGLKYFSDEKVDVAVIEVGLGGRLDATNCIHPLLSIITSISLDHESILGDTLEKIAYEKAGIIKENVPVLLGPTVTQDSVIKKAIEMHAPIERISTQTLDYDMENQSIAKRALELLNPHFKINLKCLKEALLSKPPCRLEKTVYHDREIILDVSHNEAGLKRLFQNMRVKYPNRKLVVFFALSIGRMHQNLLNIYQENADELYLLDLKHPRLESIDVIKMQLKCSYKVASIKDVDRVLNKQPKEKIFLFTGSVFFMKDLRETLGLPSVVDPYPIFEGSFSFFSTQIR